MKGNKVVDKGNKGVNKGNKGVNKEKLVVRMVHCCNVDLIASGRATEISALHPQNTSRNVLC